jgi:hypothetical protein
VWRLVRKRPDPDDLLDGELVVNVQGVLCRLDLPPFHQRISYVYRDSATRCITKCSNRTSSNHVRYLRQSISLTGLGAAFFDSCVDGMSDVLLTFSRCIAVQKLATCSLVDSFDKYSCVELSNRYFTARKDVTAEQHMPLSSDVDPKGFLAEAAGNLYVHATENVVNYFALNTTRDGADRLAATQVE